MTLNDKDNKLNFSLTDDNVSQTTRCSSSFKLPVKNAEAVKRDELALCCFLWIR